MALSDIIIQIVVLFGVSGVNLAIMGSESLRIPLLQIAMGLLTSAIAVNLMDLPLFPLLNIFLVALGLFNVFSAIMKVGSG